MQMTLTATRELSAPTIPTLPAAVTSATFAGTTFGTAVAGVARFDVEWSTTGDATLVPVSAAATSLAEDAASASRLRALADAVSLTAGDGPNRVGRLALATTTDAWTAARMLPRVEAQLAASGPEAATDLLRLADAIARQDADAEFLPSADEIVIGPEASRTLLGTASSADVTAATPTRAVHVVRHELAHASQPVDVAELEQPATRVFEEARAELVTRWDPRTSTFAARLGLPFDASELADSGTYAFQQEVLTRMLRAAGVQPGSPAAVQLLANTPGQALPGAIAAHIAARIGASAPEIELQLRAASSSLKRLDGLLSMLGLGS